MIGEAIVLQPSAPNRPPMACSATPTARASQTVTGKPRTISHLGLASVRARDVLGDASDTFVRRVARFLRQRADGAQQLGRLRDHVVGGAAVDLGDRHHRRIEDVDAPRDEHLERADDLAGDRNGSIAWCGIDAWPPLPSTRMISLSAEASIGPALAPKGPRARWA